MTHTKERKSGLEIETQFLHHMKSGVQEPQTTTSHHLHLALEHSTQHPLMTWVVRSLKNQKNLSLNLVTVLMNQKWLAQMKWILISIMLYQEVLIPLTLRALREKENPKSLKRNKFREERSN